MFFLDKIGRLPFPVLRFRKGDLLPSFPETVALSYSDFRLCQEVFYSSFGKAGSDSKRSNALLRFAFSMRSVASMIVMPVSPHVLEIGSAVRLFRSAC